jgi:hypothetical protein
MALALAHSAAIDNGSAMLDAGFFDTVAGYEVYFIFGAAHRAEQLKQCVLQLVPNPGNCRVVKHGDGATPLAGSSNAWHAGTDQAR